MIFYRNKNLTQIRYLYIALEAKLLPLFFSPQEFTGNSVLEFVQRSPKNLMQIGRSMDVLESSIKRGWADPVEFNVTRENDLKESIAFCKEFPSVTLFIIDADSDFTIKNIELIKENFPHFYLHIINGQNNQEKIIKYYENIVFSPKDFIKRLIKDQNEIKSYLKKFEHLLEFELKPVSNQLEYEIQESYFSTTFPNSRTLNQITNKQWFDNKEYLIEEEDEEKKFTQISEKALKNRDSFQRQMELLKKVEEIDWFFKIGIEEGFDKLVNNSDPLFPPLVIISPYQNPQLAKIFRLGKKEPEYAIFNYSLLVEQTKNYIILIDSKDIKDENDMQQSLSAQKLTRARLTYLDNVGYFHSTFNYSPVIRLPLVGKSINRDLSFFQPNTFTDHSKLTVRKKVKKTINSLGQKLKEKLVSPELENVLSKRNSQIVAISDLPIEWLSIKGIPFSFTHDICRIPETPLGGTLAHYMSNLQLFHVIDEDILQNTLVIFGADEPAFKAWRNYVEGIRDEIGFKTVHCDSIKDVTDTVSKHKPEFLIFDCHGGTNKDDYSSYLLIGDERLTNEEIKANNIFAPIIFLSACGTVPNYGFFNSIVQGFFEAGALCVTGTYLPLEIYSSSLLYVRILTKLKSALELKVHKNWLEFISHIVRTSSIMDAMTTARKKAGVWKNLTKEEIEEFLKKYHGTTLQALTESLFFNRRRKIYHEMDDRINRVDNKLKNTFSQTVPEYLYYTHMGRPDLILFKSWIDKKRDLNFPSVNEETLNSLKS